MNKSTLKKLFQLMEGYRTMYFVGIIGFALLLLIFQVQISLLFLELFNSIQEGTFEDILFPIIRFSVVILILISVIPFFSYLTAKAALKTTGALRKRVFDKLTALPIKQFRKTHSAELSSIATNDINEVEKAYGQLLFQFSVQLIVGVGAGVAMLIIEWRLALVAFSAGLLTYIINTLYAKRLRSVSRGVQDRLAHLNTRLSNILAGMHVIRVFNIQKHVLNLFTKSNKQTLDVSLVRVKRQASIDALNNLVFTISFAGITVIGGWFVLEGLILLGVIVAIIQLQNSVLDLVSELGTFISNMQTSLAAGDRIFDFLDYEEEPKSYETTIHSPKQETAVGFKDLVFGYDEQPILDKMSFEVKQGETVAFVGPSGGGKTTVFKLILHFFDWQNGGIMISGKSTSNQPLSMIRKQIAYVPQDAYLFNTSVKENIRYAKEDATEEEIIKAAKDANAHTFIEKLDHGYDTKVGEHGTKLSGGQKQRIAIARAMLKDAPILLLDEATSALDTESERLFQDALNRLKATKTTLIIAHRLSTIKDADRILVIEKGKIIEEGNHDSLLENEDSLYTKLYQTRKSYESFNKA